jgi:sporulation protein YlmC with PRC-barrel domain
MVQEEKKYYSKQLIGKTIVSKTGKRFGEVGNLTFETRTGEIIEILLKNPTGYCTGLELEKDKEGSLIIPFSSVIAVGDFVVVAEEDII